MTRCRLFLHAIGSLAALFALSFFNHATIEKTLQAVEPQFGFGPSPPINSGGSVDSFGNNAWSQAIPRPTPMPQTTNPNFGTNQSMPNLAPPRRDLQFGAYLENTVAGAVVKEIQPGSSAARAGVMSGDVIVTVAGYQVGYVDGRLYDLGDEVSKRTSPEGRITMLVLEARNRQLRPVSVDMQASNAGVSGQVSLGDRTSLPSGSILTVQIQNVDRPFYEVRGGQQVMQVEGYGPFPVQINYDSRWVEPRDRYAISAYLTYNGQTIYSLAAPMQINLAGAIPPVNLTLTRPQVVQASATRNVGYPPDTNAIVQTYQRILGKSPSMKELEAWTQYLSTNVSPGELEASLLSSPPFYDLCGNDPTRFVQRMIYVTTSRQAAPADVSRWTTRLNQYQGARPALVREYLATVR